MSTSYYVKKKKIQFIPIPRTHACISCTMHIMFDYRWTLEDEETNQISALEPTELLVKADSTWASSLKVKYNVISIMASEEAKAETVKFQRPKSSSTPKSQFGNTAPNLPLTIWREKKKEKKKRKRKRRRRENEIKSVQSIHQSVKTDLI